MPFRASEGAVRSAHWRSLRRPQTLRLLRKTPHEHRPTRLGQNQVLKLNTTQYGHDLVVTLSIIKAFDKSNLKRPKFTIEQGGVTAIIYREVFMSIRDGQKPIQTDTQPNQNRTKTEELSIILDAVKNNPLITMDSLSDLLKITKSSVQRRLEILVKEGKLRHIGPTNGGFWELIE